MAYQFGDVVLVPFPFHRSVHQQAAPRRRRLQRPHNRIRRDVILMAITSQVRGSGAFGEVIVQDWRAAKLLKPSPSSRCSPRSNKHSPSRRSAGSHSAISRCSKKR